MNRNATYGIAAGLAAAVIVSIVALAALQTPATPAIDMRSTINEAVQGATYYTISDAATPAVVTGVNGSIYTVYFRSEGEAGNLYFQRSDDGGNAQAFTEPSRVGRDDWYMNGCPDAGPGMDFDSKGRLHMAWFTGSETALNGQGFYYTHSDDRGANFATPVPIHLLSEQWIPPTTQYLVVDGNDNSWIFFVNSEGLKKGADYDETYTYDGKGTVHLAVVDRDGNVLRNEAFATGDITKHYPFASGDGGSVVMSWMDGEDVKIAVFDTAI